MLVAFQIVQKLVFFWCAEGLGICLTFCNNGVSDWIGDWGVSFGVIGVSVWTELSSFLSDLVLGVFYISLWSNMLRYNR